MGDSIRFVAVPLNCHIVVESGVDVASLLHLSRVEFKVLFMLGLKFGGFREFLVANVVERYRTACLCSPVAGSPLELS